MRRTLRPETRENIEGPHSVLQSNTKPTCATAGEAPRDVNPYENGANFLQVFED